MAVTISQGGVFVLPAPPQKSKGGHNGYHRAAPGVGAGSAKVLPCDNAAYGPSSWLVALYCRDVETYNKIKIICG